MSLSKVLKLIDISDNKKLLSFIVLKYRTNDKLNNTVLQIERYMIVRYTPLCHLTNVKSNSASHKFLNVICTLHDKYKTLI